MAICVEDAEAAVTQLSRDQLMKFRAWFELLKVNPHHPSLHFKRIGRYFSVLQANQYLNRQQKIAKKYKNSMELQLWSNRHTLAQMIKRWRNNAMMTYANEIACAAHPLNMIDIRNSSFRMIIR